MFIRTMPQTEVQQIVRQAEAARRDAIMNMGVSIVRFVKSLLTLPVMTLNSKAV